MRNEITDRQSDRSARGWMAEGGGYDASNPRNRAQRHTLALRDVAYVVRAQLALREGVAENIAKFRDQFRRRVSRGQCFATPYLGCREFTACFSEPDPDDEPIDRSEDLGPMLLDIDYDPDRSGRGTPRFFRATLEQRRPAHPRPSTRGDLMLLNKLKDYADERMQQQPPPCYASTPVAWIIALDS